MTDTAPNTLPYSSVFSSLSGLASKQHHRNPGSGQEVCIAKEMHQCMPVSVRHGLAFPVHMLLTRRIKLYKVALNFKWKQCKEGFKQSFPRYDVD